MSKIKTGYIFGIGGTNSFDINWVLHGPQASWKPAVTMTGGLGGGASMGGMVDAGQSWYSGDAKDINRAMLSTNSAKGGYPTAYLSAAAVEGLKAGLTGAYTKVNSGYIYGYQVNVGVGLPVGPVPVNFSTGVTNTLVLKDFFFQKK